MRRGWRDRNPVLATIGLSVVLIAVTLAGGRALGWL